VYQLIEAGGGGLLGWKCNCVFVTVKLVCESNHPSCEEVRIYVFDVFDPHTSNAKSRLTITLIITPGFSRINAGVFLGRILGIFCNSCNPSNRKYKDDFVVCYSSVLFDHKDQIIFFTICVIAGPLSIFKGPVPQSTLNNP
jgi:hypothetical protein